MPVHYTLLNSAMKTISTCKLSVHMGKKDENKQTNMSRIGVSKPTNSSL
jgi:hypothetical protein